MAEPASCLLSIISGPANFLSTTAVLVSSALEKVSASWIRWEKGSGSKGLWQIKKKRKKRKIAQLLKNMLRITKPGLSGPLSKRLEFILSYAAVGKEASLEDDPARCPDQLLDGSENIEDCIVCVTFRGREDRGMEHGFLFLWLQASIWKRTEVSRRHHDPLVSSKRHERVEMLGF